MDLISTSFDPTIADTASFRPGTKDVDCTGMSWTEGEQAFTSKALTDDTEWTDYLSVSILICNMKPNEN